MPRATWPLLGGRPKIEVVLTRATDGEPLIRQLLADSGAGAVQSKFDLILELGDCLLCGGRLVKPILLGGAYRGSFTRYRLRVQVPNLGFDRFVRVVAVSAPPEGFDGIACFRFLNRFGYGNFGDLAQFGLETP